MIAELIVCASLTVVDSYKEVRKASRPTSRFNCQSRTECEIPEP